MSANRIDVVLLKSPDFGAWRDDPRTGRGLPYRIDHLTAAGVRLRWSDAPHRTPWASPPLADVLRWAGRRGPPFLQTVLSLARIARSDAVLAMFESEGNFLAWLRRLGIPPTRGTPLVVVTCWLAELLARYPPDKRDWYRRTYQHVDRLVFHSANQADVFAEVLGLPPERLSFVPFGVDHEFFTPSAHDDEGFLLAVGRDRGRDWPLTFDAARRAGVHLKVACRPHDLDGVPIPQGVEVLGHVDRATYRDLLSRARAVVVATRTLAYPSGQSVLLEAMAMGRCCVVTDSPAMRDYLLPGENALVVPPGDPQALADGMATAERDTDARRRIASRAREIVLERYTAEHMWQRIGTALHEVAATHA